MKGSRFFATCLGLLIVALLFTGCGGGSSTATTGAAGGTTPDLSAQTASARLDFNQVATKGRQETRSSILPASTDTLSVVGLDIGGSKVFGAQDYPRPAEDVLVVTVPVTVTRLLVTARAGHVDLTTFAVEPKLRLGTVVTVPFDQFRVVGVVIKSMQTSKMPSLVNGTDVTASVAAESPTGLALTYAWETTGGFAITSVQPYGTSVSITAPATYSASGAVKVTVRDSQGATAVGTVALTTVAKDAPVISSLMVTPDPVVTVADIVATALDPLGGPLTYNWTLGGLPLTGNSNRVQWTSPGIPGACEVAVRATGATGLFADATKLFSIGSASPWPRRHRDLQGTGLSTVDTSQNVGTLAWSYATASVVLSSPAIGADGTVYVGSGDNKLYALRPDGTLKWAYPTAGKIRSSPAIGADGTVYVGSGDNNVYALLPDGTLKWSYATGNAVYYSSPAIGADGTVYLGSVDNKLYALRSDGSLKWAYTTGSFVESSPAIGADGTVYVGSVDNKLYALRPDGSVKWSYAAGAGLYSSPAIAADGTVYVGSVDNKLYALRPDGSLKWLYTTGGWVNSSPALGADGTVYVGSDDYNLCALRPDGSLRWSYTTGDRVRSSPAVGADGTVYVGSLDNCVYALRPDGTLRWSYATASDINSSPAIGADGTVYVGSDDGKLYAIK